MSNVVIICGDTGTGKTRSLKNLNPDETYIINVLDKALPFEGSRSMYNADKKNIYSTDDWNLIHNMIISLPEKRPEIKNLIIDDLGFSMTAEFFKRSAETGYTKFADFGKHMQMILSACKNIKTDLNVALMFHEDDEYSDKLKTGKKVKLIGQMLDDKYNPLAIVSVCLFTDVSYNKTGMAEYNFITNRIKVDDVVIPAKSPEGMFDNIKVPNDLAMVFEKMNSYYDKTV